MLRRELSNIVLYELNDPRTGFLTLTAVELSEDQRSAEVGVMVRGSEEEVAETLAVLNHAHGYIQGLIGRRLRLRYTPVLSFSEDTSMRHAMHIEALIDRARREDREFKS